MNSLHILQQTIYQGPSIVAYTPAVRLILDGGGMDLFLNLSGYFIGLVYHTHHSTVQLHMPTNLVDHQYTMKLFESFSQSGKVFSHLTLEGFGVN